MTFLLYLAKVILLVLVTFPGIGVEGRNCTQCEMNATSPKTEPLWQKISCAFGHKIGKPCPSGGSYSCIVKLVRDEAKKPISLTRGCEVSANLPTAVCSQDEDVDFCYCDAENCNDKSFDKYFGYGMMNESNETTTTRTNGNSLEIPIAAFMAISVALLLVCT